MFAAISSCCGGRRKRGNDEERGDREQDPLLDHSRSQRTDPDPSSTTDNHAREHSTSVRSYDALSRPQALDSSPSYSATGGGRETERRDAEREKERERERVRGIAGAVGGRMMSIQYLHPSIPSQRRTSQESYFPSQESTGGEHASSSGAGEPESYADAVKFDSNGGDDDGGEHGHDNNEGDRKENGNEEISEVPKKLSAPPKGSSTIPQPERKKTEEIRTVTLGLGGMWGDSKGPGSPSGSSKNRALSPGRKGSNSSLGSGGPKKPSYAAAAAEGITESATSDKETGLKSQSQSTSREGAEGSPPNDADVSGSGSGDAVGGSGGRGGKKNGRGRGRGRGKGKGKR